MTTPTTPPVRIVAVNAGLGEPSSTRLLIDRLVDATRADLLAAGVAVDDVAVEIINLRDLAAEIGASLAGGFPTGTVRTAMAAVENAVSADAFRPGERVLLVDDVLTSGATAEACSRVLLETGAAAVEVLAAARVPEMKVFRPKR